MSPSRRVKNSVSAKKAPGAYHHGDLRNGLLSAARELLRTRGVEALSLREVAQQLGVSAAAPYRHFESKEALLSAVGAHGLATLTQSLSEAVAKISGAKEQLCELARVFFDFAATQPYLLPLVPIDGDFYGLASEIFSDGQTRGIFRKSDAANQAQLFWSTVVGFSHLHATSAKGGQTALRELVTLSFDGLAKK